MSHRQVFLSLLFLLSTNWIAGTESEKIVDNKKKKKQVVKTKGKKKMIALVVGGAALFSVAIILNRSWNKRAKENRSQGPLDKKKKEINKEEERRRLEEERRRLEEERRRQEEEIREQEEERRRLEEEKKKLIQELERYGKHKLTEIEYDTVEKIQNKLNYRFKEYEFSKMSLKELRVILYFVKEEERKKKKEKEERKKIIDQLAEYGIKESDQISQKFRHNTLHFYGYSFSEMSLEELKKSLKQVEEVRQEEEKVRKKEEEERKKKEKRKQEEEKRRQEEKEKEKIINRLENECHKESFFQLSDKAKESIDETRRYHLFLLSKMSLKELQGVLEIELEIQKKEKMKPIINQLKIECDKNKFSELSKELLQKVVGKEIDGFFDMTVEQLQKVLEGELQIKEEKLKEEEERRRQEEEIRKQEEERRRQEEERRKQEEKEKEKIIYRLENECGKGYFYQLSSLSTKVVPTGVNMISKITLKDLKKILNIELGIKKEEPEKQKLWNKLKRQCDKYSLSQLSKDILQKHAGVSKINYLSDITLADFKKVHKAELKRQEKELQKVLEGELKIKEENLKKKDVWENLELRGKEFSIFYIQSNGTLKEESVKSGSWLPGGGSKDPVLIPEKRVIMRYKQGISTMYDIGGGRYAGINGEILAAQLIREIGVTCTDNIPVAIQLKQNKNRAVIYSYMSDSFAKMKEQNKFVYDSKVDDSSTWNPKRNSFFIAGKKKKTKKDYIKLLQELMDELKLFYERGMLSFLVTDSVNYIIVKNEKKPNEKKPSEKKPSEIAYIPRLFLFDFDGIYSYSLAKTLEKEELKERINRCIGTILWLEDKYEEEENKKKKNVPKKPSSSQDNNNKKETPKKPSSSQDNNNKKEAPKNEEPKNLLSYQSTLTEHFFNEIDTSVNDMVDITKLKQTITTNFEDLLVPVLKNREKNTNVTVPYFGPKQSVS